MLNDWGGQNNVAQNIVSVTFYLNFDKIFKIMVIIMVTKKETLLKRMMTRQWSFFWAGITFGIAQIIYMLGLWIHSAQAGKTALLKPITVTTDLGKMFRGLEVTIYQLFSLPDFQLYGRATDGIASSGGAFIPGIGWPIVGMIIGGWIVGRMEKEHRTWAYYPWHVLAISFVGGAFFSYGTRLAGGCTLNHLLGGIPLLNIHSFITVAFMAIGGGLAFYLLSKVNMSPYFKHQETLSYVKNADAGERLTYREGYNPRKRFIFWFSLIFSVSFVGVAVFGGLFNPESLQHLKGGQLAAFSKSVDAKGWYYVILTLVAGIVGGFGMAKSGFGTECSLVSAEAGGMMARNDSKYAKLGVPKITRTLMRSYLPLVGIMASWVVMLGFIMLAWIFFDTGPAFAGSLKYQTTLGNLIGGLFLGAGAVMLIGCEIRSYMRIGMGYLNTWVGFMGFAIGYLPFTLFYEQHKAFLNNTLMIEAYKWYDLMAPGNESAHKVILGLWWVILTAGLVYVVKRGSRATGAPTDSLLNKNTEDLEVEIEEGGEKNGGKYRGVPVPASVPAE
ncbi:FIG01165415: hypothetical protein [hydrothermal vent metagenome]|uniref:Sulphur transport domain-containing protein n=1 Tax=hydrothermal vent metagenome TaxID=652676 RepID=A0A3B0RJL5_9ZZZZ